MIVTFDKVVIDDHVFLVLDEDAIVFLEGAPFRFGDFPKGTKVHKLEERTGEINALLCIPKKQPQVARVEPESMVKKRRIIEAPNFLWMRGLSDLQITAA